MPSLSASINSGGGEVPDESRGAREGEGLVNTPDEEAARAKVANGMAVGAEAGGGIGAAGIDEAATGLRRWPGGVPLVGVPGLLLMRGVGDIGMQLSA